MADAERFPRGEVAIAGIGCTEFSRRLGVGVFTLAARAVKAAVADAGLELSDVDGFAHVRAERLDHARTSLPRRSASQSMSYYVDQFFGGSVS